MQKSPMHYTDSDFWGGGKLQVEPELCSCENSLFSPKILEPEMLKSHDNINVETKTEDMFYETPL